MRTFYDAMAFKFLFLKTRRLSWSGIVEKDGENEVDRPTDRISQHGS